MANPELESYHAETLRASQEEGVVCGEVRVNWPDGSASASERSFGRNLLGLIRMESDFDAPLPEEVLQDFGL